MLMESYISFVIDILPHLLLHTANLALDAMEKARVLKIEAQIIE